MSDMKVTAIAPWFGSKRNLAPKIVQELGEHRSYWEPFCGGMSVLLAKPPCTMETVNDLHGDLINLARTIQNQVTGPALYRRLRRVWMDEALYNECQHHIDEWPAPSQVAAIPNLDRAVAYFIASWLGRNGTSGLQRHRIGKAFCLRYTKNGGASATRFRSAIDSIPAWRRRMRGVTILMRDGFKIIDRIEDAKGVAVYVDPPYVKKNAQYEHDFSGIDHHRLAKALGRFQETRVVVSYYDHPELHKWYEGWTFIDCATTKAMPNQAMRGRTGATKAPEVLIVNGPSYMQEAPA